MAFLLLATLLLSLAGCSRPQSFRGTLVLWEPPRWPVNGDTSAWTKDRLVAFEKAHPGVKAVLETKPAADLEQALDKAWNNGQGPDLALAPFRPDWAKDGRLQPLDGLLTADEAKDFLPGTLDAARLVGRLYGLPAGAEPVVLVLNLDVFARRNVMPPADGRWTWQQFEATLRSLSGKDSSGKSTYGLGYYVLSGFYEFWPLWTDGAPLLDPASGALILSPTGSARQGIARLAAWTQSSDLLWPGSARRTPEELWRAFVGPEASVAMAPWGSWALPLLEQDKFRTRAAVAHFPTDGGQAATTGKVTTYLLRTQGDALKARAALDLALFLTDAAARSEQAKYAGVLPVRRSAGNLFGSDPVLGRAADMVAEMASLPADQARRQAMDRLQQRVQYALLGAMTPEQALTQPEAGGAREAGGEGGQTHATP